MARRNYTPEEITEKLAQAEEHIAKGLSVPTAALLIGVNYTTLFHWRRRFPGATDDSSVLRIKRLEAENARLRKAIAMLDLAEQGHAPRRVGGRSS